MKDHRRLKIDRIKSPFYCVLVLADTAFGATSKRSDDGKIKLVVHESVQNQCKQNSIK